MLTRCEEITCKVCEDFEAELKEFNGECDHVHLLINYPPKVAVSKLVNSLKGVSARRIRQEFTGRINRTITHEALWSPSYFSASCGGAPLAIVRQCIEQQKRPL
jgi:putative transposase